MGNHSGFIGAVLALVLLAVPAVATLFDIVDGPDEPHAESVARTPVLSSGMSRWVTDTRFYIKQRFATKEHMTTLNSVVKTELFASSPYTDVSVGDSGFLFLTDSEAVDYHQRSLLFSPAELSHWRDALSSAAARLAQLGARYHVLIAPNKDSLYRDHLPAWVRQQRHLQSRLDQLLAALNDTPVGITYPLAELQQALVDFPQATPFFKTDTHWNEFGAGIGAAALWRDLAVPMAGTIQPRPFTPNKAGDLARMIGQQGLLAEQGWTLADEWLTAQCVRSDGQPFVYHQTDLDRFLRLDCTGGKANGLKALIFVDSFGAALVPALSAGFEEVVFVWQYRLDEALVEQLQPDVVIHQWVERKLQTLTPDQLFAGP